jgi:hypothetical protein
MGDRTGLGIVDLALLQTIDGRGSGRPDGVHSKCASVIGSLDEGLGLAPSYAYGALCDLARPWVLQAPLIEYHGDLGTRDLPSAPMQHCECRLSGTGACAVSAESGEIAPVPLGLINGNLHLAGYRPPFDAHGVVAAIRLLLNDRSTSDADVIEAVGGPVLATGSEITGDLDALNAGEWTEVVVKGVVAVDEAADTVVIDCLPPESSPERLAQLLLGQYFPRPAADDPLTEEEMQLASLVMAVDDQSTVNADRLVCTPAPGVSALQLRDHLRDLRELDSWFTLELPSPLPTLVRDWVNKWADEDLAASLDLLDAAVDLASR